MAGADVGPELRGLGVSGGATATALHRAGSSGSTGLRSGVDATHSSAFFLAE